MPKDEIVSAERKAWERRATADCLRDFVRAYERFSKHPKHAAPECVCVFCHARNSLRAIEAELEEGK